MKPATLTISLTLLFAVSLPDRAAAQFPRVFAGGVAGSHRESADFASGTATAAGAVAGVWLTRSLGIEVEASRPTHGVTREYEGFSVSFAGRGATREEIERLAVYSRFTHQRTVKSLVSVGIVHAKAFVPRWSSRLFAGVTNRLVEEREVFTPLRYPEGVDPERLATVRATDTRFTRNVGALTVGGGVAFAATRRLSVAPELRLDVGSIGDEINNGIRSSVRVMWTF